ncbi:MAG: ion transporter [Lentisphaeraceae bacterium]|nr:ion transporter [Lentisphaeraceae bacterium]
MKNTENELKPWQNRLHEIIYEADTPTGKLFDVVLIVAILFSVLAVMLETVDDIYQKYEFTFFCLEWFFTAIFTVEYILRLVTILKPTKYMFSFFGIIDLLAILPSYVGIFLVESQVHSLAIVRILRVFRIFRVLKLTPYLSEANILTRALKASRRKVFIFFSSVLFLSVILGAIMFLIENSSNAQFSSIPKGIYWAIVTITTVGYGDISPVTTQGQFLSAFVMILGYAIIAVPTGIVTVEITEAMKKAANQNTQVCPSCTKEGHDKDANNCKYCGNKL